MKAIAEVDEKKRKRMMPRSSVSAGSCGAPPKYHMVYTPLWVSYADHNSSRIGAIAHNTNSDSSSSSSSCSTMLLLHRCSRLPSGHHSSFVPTTFHASTASTWGTLLMNAASPSKASHHELRHPSSINRGANKRVLHNGLATPTTTFYGHPHRRRSASRYVLPQ
jgi:hypothetical protein